MLRYSAGTGNPALVTGLESAPSMSSAISGLGQGVPSGQIAVVKHILLHLHLFKNAGTSFDAILKKSFGSSWIEQEFAPPQTDQADAVRALLQENQDIAALSSHTLLFPVPKVPGVEFFPVLFVREPLARLRSAYEFERLQDADTRGAILAKQCTFGEYLRQRLATPNDRACRDFQTYRLALYIPRSLGTERARALAAVDLLPFVGLVERFDQSIAVLQARIQHIFPNFQGFSVRKNVTAASLDEKTILENIKLDLGFELFDIVVEANQGDLALYEKVKRLYL